MAGTTPPHQGSRPVRIGVQIAQYGASWATLLDLARESDARGIDALFNWDHFYAPDKSEDKRHFECWTTLAAWAAATSRIELGPMVNAIGYRNPDLVADMARTVDHISGGRCLLGVGAGFKQRDYDGYGYEFGTPASRAAELAEGLDRITRRFGLLDPAPMRQIPLLIGGSGPRFTLPLVARHADVWHTFEEGEGFVRKSTLLDQLCRANGRDPREVERSVLVAGDPKQVGAPLLGAGATLFVIPVAAASGDFSGVDRWLAWRDQQNTQPTR